MEVLGSSFLMQVLARIDATPLNPGGQHGFASHDPVEIGVGVIDSFLPIDLDPVRNGAGAISYVTDASGNVSRRLDSGATLYAWHDERDERYQFLNVSVMAIRVRKLNDADPDSGTVDVTVENLGVFNQTFTALEAGFDYLLAITDPGEPAETSSTTAITVQFSTAGDNLQVQLCMLGRKTA